MATSVKETGISHTGEKQLRLGLVLMVIVLVVVGLAAFLVMAAGFTGSRTSAQSVLDTDAARYDAMTAFYADQIEAWDQAREADVARWVALGDIYTASAQDREAEASRFDAMTVFYIAEQAKAWDRARVADVARWVALGDDYTAQAQARAADTARFDAMTSFYTTAQAEAWQQARDADVARWIAVGNSYSAGEGR